MGVAVKTDLRNLARVPPRCAAGWRTFYPVASSLPATAVLCGRAGWGLSPAAAAAAAAAAVAGRRQQMQQRRLYELPLPSPASSPPAAAAAAARVMRDELRHALRSGCPGLVRKLARPVAGASVGLLSHRLRGTQAAVH